MNVKRMREAELVKWNPGQEALIARYVDSLLSILSVGDDGRVHTKQIFELDIFLKILSDNTTLYDISDDEVKRSLIQGAAFRRLKKYTRQDIHMFRRALAAEVRKHLSRTAKSYWVLLPLHAVPGELENTRSISVLGMRLLFRDWDYVQRRLDLQAFLNASRAQLASQRFTMHSHDFALVTHFSPVLVLSEGRDVREAFYTANRSFDLLRWLINLMYQFRKVPRQWGGYPKPLGKILPPPTCGVFNSDGSFNLLSYTLTKYGDYPRNTLQGTEIGEARKLASRLKKPQNSDETLAVLIQALEKYGQALDAFEWRLAFLLLWQILELITLQSAENLNMKTVRNRVCCLLEQDPVVRDLLAALYETRNSFVHQGSFPGENGLREVNLLKFIVEESINALFSLLRICPNTASLRRYYEHLSAGDSGLADRQRLIRNIRQRRSR